MNIQFWKFELFDGKVSLGFTCRGAILVVCGSAVPGSCEYDFFTGTVTGGKGGNILSLLRYIKGWQDPIFKHMYIFIYVYGIHIEFSPNQTYGVYMSFFLTAFSWRLYNC